jgi:hypothetical protein
MVLFFFFCGEGPHSRSYGRTAALRLSVQSCDDQEQDDQYFSFFQIIEHRWNEIDKGKPKYSGKNLSQCHFVHHKAHMDPGLRGGRPATNRLSHGTAYGVVLVFGTIK